MLLETFLTALALLVAGVWTWMWRRHSYWRVRGVVGPSPSFPLGNFTASLLGRRALFQDVEAIYNRHRDEPYVGFFFLHTPLLMINDLDIVKQVVIKEFHDFNGHGVVCDPERDHISGNIFALSGQPWRNLRVKLSPAFTSGKMRFYFSRVLECVAGLQRSVGDHVAKCGGRYQLDVRELTSSYTIDLITSLVFGLESDALSDPGVSAMRHIGKEAMKPSYRNSLIFALNFFGRDILTALNMTINSAEVNSFFRKLVGDIVSHREREGVERADMMNLLIQLKNKGFLPPDRATDGSETEQNKDDLLQKLTVDEVTAQAFAFFAAGYDSSSLTTSYILYELVKNPDILQKVTDEIDRVMKEHNGEITYDGVNSLPYLDMVIKETLRLYPAFPFLNREASTRRTLPGTKLMLEKGQLLLVPISSIQRNPDIWPNPDTFDPERFSEENKASIHPMAYLPFGDGPRICIGMRLATVAMKAGLMGLLSRFAVSRSPHTPDQVVMTPGFILPVPKGGFPITMTTRSTTAT